MAVLSDYKIQNLKKKKSPYIVTEESGRGEGRLQIKVYSSGVKSFQIQYFINQKKTYMVLGRYPDLSVADARKLHRQKIMDVRKGINPKKTNPKIDLLVSVLIDDYLQSLESRGVRSADIIATTIAKDFRPSIEGMRCSQLTIDPIMQCSANIMQRDALHVASLVMSNIKAMLLFAKSANEAPDRHNMPPKYQIDNQLISDIPAIKRTQNKKERYFDESEIKKIWTSTELNRLHQLYYCLNLALAGQRVEQVLHARFSEFNIEQMLFVIPQERVKVKGYPEHVVPISELVLPILQELRDRCQGSQYLFPGAYDITKIRPVTSWANYNKFAADILDIPIFSTRDIRRSCKTNMAKAGVEYRDELQQHLKSDVGAKHYDRYQYLLEKQKSMEKWTEFLKRTILG